MEHRFYTNSLTFLRVEMSFKTSKIDFPTKCDELSYKWNINKQTLIIQNMHY